MGFRILLVEDEDGIADFIVRGLREEGFDVERKSDGEVGLRHAQSPGWDAILLDWQLPGLDGLTFLRRLRRGGASTPVLMLTARDAVSDRVRGLDEGADDYLCKPFAFDELLARIRVLARRASGDGATLTFRDVRIDLASQRVERGGRRVELTAKEYSLLVFFFRHPEQVLTRARIYDHVWEERFDGLSNTLEVHVMELRRKLEAFGPRIIHTLRSRGYRLGGEESS